MGRKRRRTEDAVEAGSGGDGTGAEVPERFADAKRKGEAVRKEKRARHTPAEEPRTWARTARATETHSKSGKFSKKEDQAILDAVQAYVTENSMGEEGIARLCDAKYDKSVKGAWRHVAAALPYRSIESVYVHGVRLLQRRLRQTGKWTPEEESVLLQMVDERGRKFSSIAKALDRERNAVRDKYNELVALQRDTARRGTWTCEEEETLIMLVKALTPKSAPRDASGIPMCSIPYDEISDRIGSRTPDQVRDKWRALYPKLLGQTRWTMDDDLQLVEALYKSGAEDETEVEWGALGMSHPTSILSSRYFALRKRVRHSQEMPFGEVLDALVLELQRETTVMERVGMGPRATTAKSGAE